MFGASRMIVLKLIGLVLRNEDVDDVHNRVDKDADVDIRTHVVAVLVGNRGIRAMRG